MPYGPITTDRLARLAGGISPEEAGSWNPACFTLPFPRRFMDFLSDWFDLPLEAEDRRMQAYRLVNSALAEHGIEFGKATLSEWLSGGRDPSVTSWEGQTRDNIYKICAALELDLDMTEELFEKVFFSRAFNLKRQRELCYYYYSRRETLAGEDPRWYEKAEALLRTVEGREAAPFSGKTSTEEILLCVENAEEEVFREYLGSRGELFRRENEYVRASEAVRVYASFCAETLGLKEPDEEDIPYDPLLNEILGYTQRNVTRAAAGVGTLKFLPAQLTANFPTGQILRGICLGEETGGDRICKMLTLLLFAYYFSAEDAVGGSDGFDSFLSFAKRELENVGFNGLYPSRPFDGMILFCAADEEPLEALQRFIADSVRREEEQNLLAMLFKAFPGCERRAAETLLTLCERDYFTVRLLCEDRSLTPEEACRALRTARIAEGEGAEKLQQLLLDVSPAVREGRAMLRYSCLFPLKGIGCALAGRISGQAGTESLRELVSHGWLREEKNCYRVESAVRLLMAQQEDFPRRANCGELQEPLERFAADIGSLSKEERRQLSELLTRFAALDGTDRETKKRLKTQAKTIS